MEKQKICLIFSPDDENDIVAQRDAMTAATVSFLIISVLLVEFVVGSLVGWTSTVVSIFNNDGWCWDACEYPQSLFALASFVFFLYSYHVFLF